MKTKLTLRQVNVRSGLKELLLSRLDRFDKFFSADTPAELTLSEKREHKILELTISAGGKLFRAEVEGESYQSNLDEAIDIIERQIRRHKTRLQKQVKSGALSDLILPADTDTDPADPYEELPFSVRTKTFSLKPMSVEEAILQMDLLGHSFFVFRNNETDGVAVVYSKKDGTYGLILPTE